MASSEQPSAIVIPTSVNDEGKIEAKSGRNGPKSLHCNDNSTVNNKQREIVHYIDNKVFKALSNSKIRARQL